MKYAVTGAAGLIGKSLTIWLADQGHFVNALIRNEAPKEFLKTSFIRVYKGDITDLESMRHCFKGCDGVFHAAAITKPWVKDSSLYYLINETGTENVCKLALECEVKRVVLTSTAGIHGPQQNGNLVDEQTWPTSYRTDYEQSKFNGMQRAFQFLQKGLEVNAVSPPRVYAAAEPTRSNVPVRLLHIYLKNRVGLVPGNGKGLGSYTFMENIVQGHWLAMTKAPSGEEYLLGGENLSYLDFYRIIAEVSGKKYPILKMPYQLSLVVGQVQLWLANSFGIEPKITTPWVKKYLKSWAIDSSKIEKLGYKPISFKDGLTRVLEYRQKQ